MLTIEQLLQPRYRVIGPYPFSPYKVGDIIEINSERFMLATINATSEEGEFEYPLMALAPMIEEFPNLFEPVYWSKNRTADEFPEYVVIKGREQIYKVHKTSSHEGVVCEIICTDEKNTFVCCFLGNLERPATKEEYEAYKKKNI